MSTTKLTIDPEFRSLCPPLSPDEKQQLENSLKAHGCQNALVVWKGKGILLDGHNRHDLCGKNNLTFKTIELDFPDRNAAKQWIVANQLSRRNLTPEAASYLRGKRYNAEKKTKSPGRPEKGDQTAHVKTHERLAQEYKVAPATIRRDGRFAAAVDAIAGNCGSKARELILSRDAGISRGIVARVAKQTSKQQHAFIEDQRKVTDEFRKTGKRPVRKQKQAKTRTTITLPTKPKQFAASVLKRFSPAEAVAMAQAIMAAAKHAKNGDGKA